MSSNRQEAIDAFAADQEYGDRFISFPEQSESDPLKREQIDILLQNENRLDDLNVSFETDMEGETWLESGNTVGAARIGSGRDWVGVQITPKVDNADFLRMVEFTSVGMESGESEIETDVEDAPTVDLVVNYFAQRVNKFLQGQNHRAYEYKKSVDEGQIKGKVLMEDYVRQSLSKSKPHVVPHQYVDFTADNFENQVIAYSTHLAIQLAKASESKLSDESLETLQECRRRLAGVSIRRIAPTELRRFRFSRVNEEFKPIFRLCELIISNSSVTLGRRQRVPFFSFDLEMPNLFERYVATLFDHVYGPLFTSEKASLKFPISTGGKKIELDGLYDGDLSIVVESKYKIVEKGKEPETKGEEPLVELNGNELSRNDLYQTVAYNSHRDVRADAAVIVYPSWEDSDEYAEVYDDITSFGWFPGSSSGTSIYPVTINLSKPPAELANRLKEELEIGLNW